MTGEITLQGRVLPVGGIKEKILAGVARGLAHVIIPQQNVKDLEDVPPDLLKRITVHPVRFYDEVRALAFSQADSAAATAYRYDAETGASAPVSAVSVTGRNRGSPTQEGKGKHAAGNA